MKLELPCKVGDVVWIADKKNNKVFRFEIDCIKIFKDNITAHGWREFEHWNVPREYSLKYFGKRVIFATKEEAEKSIRR